MTPIMFTPPKSALDFAAEAIAVRLAYMLFERCIPSENTAYAITFERAFATENASPGLMTSLLQSACKDVNINSILKAWKGLKNAKHRTPQQIVQLKQLEKNIVKLYSIEVERLRANLIKTGLHQISEVDNFYIRGSDDRADGIISSYSIHTEDQERFDRQYLPASMVLRLGIEADELPESWATENDNGAPRRIEFFMWDDDADSRNGGKIVTMLPPEAFFSSLAEGSFLSAADEGAANENAAWMERCFSMQAPAVLSAQEMNGLRDELEGPRRAFDAVADAWAACIAPGGASPQERIARFRQEVAPAAAAMQLAIDAAPILHKVRNALKSDTAFSAEVWVGEMPVTAVWDFYRAHTPLSAATEARLQRSGAENPHCMGRWPVIAIRVPGYNGSPDTPAGAHEAAPQEDEPLLQSVRKSISVD